MNIQEAYNKGLSDAESLTIEKFNSLLEGEFEFTDTFANPDLEAVREKLIIALFPKPKPVITPEVITCGQISVDEVCKQLECLIYNEEVVECTQNLRLENLFDALSIPLAWVHSIANNSKSNISKYAKKEIQKSIELLTPKPEVL